MLAKTLLATTLAAASLTATAATVVISFQSSPFDGGSLIGESFSGQFSFDDATLTTLTATLPLLSLSFNLGGQTYTLGQADAGTTAVVFDAGALTGVNAVFSGGARQVLLSSGFGAPYASYQQDVSDYGFADLSFSVSVVPEPGAYLLMLAGLGLVGVMDRRRRAA